MNESVAARLMESLDPQKKLVATAMLCHEITVIARDTYDDAGSVAAPERLRRLNEIQHRATGHLRDILDGREGWQNGQFVLIFFGEHEDHRLQQLMRFAFERVLTVMSR